MSPLSADLGVRKGKHIDLISKFKSAEPPQALREEIPAKVLSIVSSAWQYFSQLTELSRCPTSKLWGEVTKSGFINPSLTHAHCNL